MNEVGVITGERLGYQIKLFANEHIVMNGRGIHIEVWLPGKYSEKIYDTKKLYRQGVIKISNLGTGFTGTFGDYMRMQEMVKWGINELNKTCTSSSNTFSISCSEMFNEKDYQIVTKSTKRVKSIPQKDMIVGGIYQDERGNYFINFKPFMITDGCGKSKMRSGAKYTYGNIDREVIERYKKGKEIKNSTTEKYYLDIDMTDDAIDIDSYASVKRAMIYTGVKVPVLDDCKIITVYTKYGRVYMER